MSFSITQGYAAKTTKSVAEPASATTDGAGGGLMDIWEATRDTKLNKLGKSAFENKSAFPIPAGVLATQGYAQTRSSGELMLGFGFAGQTLSPSKLPLASTVELVDGNGNALAGQSAAGLYTVSLDPEAYANGVVSGATASDPLPESYNIHVTPVADAVNYTESSVSYPRPNYVDVVFGAIIGTVTDVNGNPVDGVTVSAKNVTTGTDAAGKYTIYAPGGNSYSVTALDGTADAAANTVKADSVVVNFQYGGISVTVTGPGGVPVTEVPVEVAGQQKRTDETGQVLFPSLPLRTYDITVMSDETDELAVSSQGQIVSTSFEGGSLVTVHVKDALTGDSVRNLPAVNLTSNAVAYSDVNGRLRMAAFADNEYELLVGWRDKRYGRKTVTESLTDGDTVERTIEVEPGTAITNR